MGFYLTEAGNSILLESGDHLLLEEVLVIVPPSTVYGGGGAGTRLSGKSRAAFAKKVAEALYKPEPKERHQIRPTVRIVETPIEVIESTIRRLPIPQAQQEEAIRELRRENLPPSIGGLAIIPTLKPTTAVLGKITVSAGASINVVALETQAELAEIFARGIQNPTDEELIQMLVGN